MINGACPALPRAEYEVHGADRYSQQWADETVEVEVNGCRFKRPMARPVIVPKVGPVVPKPGTSFKQRWLSLHFRKHVQ